MGCFSSVKAYFKEFVDRSAPVQIGESHYKLENKIGEGGYSEGVYLATRESPDGTHSKFAVKKVILQTSEQEEEAAREVETLKRLKHSAILPLIDHDTRLITGHNKAAISALFMVFPAFQRGNLHDQRTRNGDFWLKPTESLEITSHIADALSYMHTLDRPLAHRDVKPGNILVDKTTDGARACLSDFGSARAAEVVATGRQSAMAIQEEAEMNSTAGYRPPELYDCKNDSHIDGRVDVWALGCSLFFALYGLDPFGDGASGSVYLAILAFRLPWPQEASLRYPQVLHDLISWLLVVDHTKRPTSCEAATRAHSLLRRHRRA